MVQSKDLSLKEHESRTVFYSMPLPAVILDVTRRGTGRKEDMLTTAETQPVCLIMELPWPAGWELFIVFKGQECGVSLRWAAQSRNFTL